ncbi:phage tail protein [Alkaliphilus peptidifermentans]|uniref:Microcystin-dependent protein n=1 Tax=Alkaliphilus peptidifermentans DSM 18978 TaxID=1120976 RepID=A0A1G5AWP3_9FIRM|nr:tail fiber protein [Alkaliphilus peptidifermentans]SCX82283.1 Microcystin-dependent protein [Alkaliphilus peptidifermentans DSM 18978]
MEGFLGEIRLFPFSFAPMGWALCNGQLLQINQNQALYSLLGTTYGGNGTTNFALPDLRGRVPIHSEAGQVGGVEEQWLTVSQMPNHTHIMVGSTNNKDQQKAEGNVLAKDERNIYVKNTNPMVNMNHAALSYSGEAQTHNNMQPYIVLNFCIALQGIYPPRN